MDTEPIAIVTLVIGQKYLESFNRTFRPSIERYAQKVGKNLILVPDFIVPTAKHPSWQKLLVFKTPLLSQYNKVLIVDGDIYITKHAKNVFDVLGDRPWGIAPNNAYNLRTLAKTDLDLYRQCPKENRPQFVVNGGMFIISRSYREQLEKIFDTYTEQACYEQGPLSYFLLNEGRGTVLPSEFNTIVHSYIEAHGCGLSTILTMYKENSFLHFVASKWRGVFYFIRWYDTTQSTVLISIVDFFAHPSFDWLTSRIFKLSEKVLGIYNYRIKKIFSK